MPDAAARAAGHGQRQARVERARDPGVLERTGALGNDACHVIDGLGSLYQVVSVTVGRAAQRFEQYVGKYAVAAVPLCVFEGTFAGTGGEQLEKRAVALADFRHRLRRGARGRRRVTRPAEAAGVARIGDQHDQSGAQAGGQGAVHFLKSERGGVQVLGVGIVGDKVAVARSVHHAVSREEEVHDVFRFCGGHEPGVRATHGSPRGSPARSPGAGCSRRG